MWIAMRAKNPEKFWKEIEKISNKLKKETGPLYSYATEHGTYTFAKTIDPDGTDVYAAFEGKRTSFGTSSLFRVKRAKRIFRNDQLKMLINGKYFDMKVSIYRTSSPEKPFWATCSKEDYRALQKLRAK
jgi:hypothetical protein